MVFIIVGCFTLAYFGFIALLCLFNYIGSCLPKSIKDATMQEVKTFKAHEMNGQTA
jgi:hypothetical protein